MPAMAGPCTMCNGTVVTYSTSSGSDPTTQSPGSDRTKAELCRLLVQAQRERDEYKKALEFYADDSGERRPGYEIDYADDWSDPIGRFLDDKGNRARAALAMFEAKEEDDEETT